MTARTSDASARWAGVTVRLPRNSVAGSRSLRVWTGRPPGCERTPFRHAHSAAEAKQGCASARRDRGGARRVHLVEVAPEVQAEHAARLVARPPRGSGHDTAPGHRACADEHECEGGDELRIATGKAAAGQTSYSAAIHSPLTPMAIRSPTALSMFRQYSKARPSTGSVTLFLRCATTLETSRLRWALSMTLRTRVPA
jgi:hypothetical protein